MRSVPGQVIGPGHCAIVRSPDGRDFMVYHAWNKAMTARQVWVDPLVWTTNGPVVERFHARITEMNLRADVAPAR